MAATIYHESSRRMLSRSKIPYVFHTGTHDAVGGEFRIAVFQERLSPGALDEVIRVEFDGKRGAVRIWPRASQGNLYVCVGWGN
ncbi:MAG: hypothetical protein AAB518_02630 [Patescibacteria group bacterium]